MNEEEIRCCINIATLDRKLPYKKLLKKMKKEHLVDVCYELLKEHLALLDIKEIFDEYTFTNELGIKYLITSTQEDRKLLDIVNKALKDSDSNE